MTLRHIQTFLAVVDNDCSITRAAEQLHVAQPAVSQTIADLESYYGIHLFDRLNRKLYLTDTGRRLLPYARRSIDDFSILDTAMKEGENAVPLRIGASLTVGTSLLPGILKGITIPVEVMVQNTEFIEQALLESRIDAAVVEGSIISKDILQKDIASDHLVAVCAPDYTREEGKTVWILREAGSGTRKLAEEAFKIPLLSEKDTKPWMMKERIWNIANTQTILELVKAGLGITVISTLLIAEDLKNRTLIDCTEYYVKNTSQSVRRSLRLVYHKDKVFDSRLQYFAERAENLCQRYS